MARRTETWLRMVLGIVAAVACSATWAQTYRVTALGAVPSMAGSFSGGNGINNAGQVAGYVYGDGPRASLWTPGVGWRDLGTLPGYDYGGARALNDAGVVVGDMLVYGPGTGLAFRWSAGSGMVRLNPLPGDNGSSVHAVNAAGLAAGISFLSQGGSTRERGALWNAAGQALPLPGAAMLRGINDAGAVVGQNDAHEASVWMPDAGMTSIAPPYSDAYDINNEGMVVGSVPGAAPNVRLGFVWTASRGLQTFAQPGGAAWTDPKAINDAGIVVGSFQFPGWRSFGFVWSEETGIRPLEQLIDPADARFGLGIYDAVAINEHGQIAALANLPDGSIGIVLTPVPEPSIVLLFAAGLVALLLRRRRTTLG